MTAFQTGQTFQIRKAQQAKLGGLTCLKSLRVIVNIAKIHRQYLLDVRDWCSDKKEELFLSVDHSKKKTNQHLDPLWVGFMVNPNGPFVMVVRNCTNIPKYTYRVHIPFKCRAENDNIDL